MVANMIRLLRARMALLAVDEAGMSTVEYSMDRLQPPATPAPAWHSHPRPSYCESRRSRRGEVRAQ